MIKLVSTSILVILFFTLSGSIKLSLNSKSSVCPNTQDQPSLVCDDFEALETDLGSEQINALIPGQTFFSKSFHLVASSLSSIIFSNNHSYYFKKIVLMVTDLPPPSQIL